MTRTYYSPTQLSMFSACKRKWWFTYPAGFKPPPTESQAIGSAIHMELEKYVKDSEWPKDPRAEEALRHLPPITDQARAEVRIDRALTSEDPQRCFLGFVDLLDLKDPKHPHIIDYKTMSDLRYAKTEHELENDAQLNCYAQQVFETVAPQAEYAKVTHIQIQTRKSIKSQATSALVSRESVTKNWNKYLVVFQDMDRVRTLTSANDVEKNENECDAYGGCFHKSRCFASSFLGLGEDMIVPPDSTRRQPGDPPATPETARKPYVKENTMNNKLAALLAGTAAPANIDAPPMQKQEVLVDEGLLVEEKTDSAPIPEVAKAAAALEAPAAQPEPPKTPANDEPTTESVDLSAGTLEYLFIDCMPVRGFREKAEPFAVWIAPLEQQIKATTGLSYEMHDFRKGVGALKELMLTAKLPKAMVINSSTPTAKIALEVLANRAKRLVQGIAA